MLILSNLSIEYFFCKFVCSPCGFFLLLSISYHKKDDNIEACFRKGRKKRRRPVNVCAVEGFILFGIADNFCLPCAKGGGFAKRRRRRDCAGILIPCLRLIFFKRLLQSLSQNLRFCQLPLHKGAFWRCGLHCFLL